MNYGEHYPVDALASGEAALLRNDMSKGGNAAIDVVGLDDQPSYAARVGGR